MLLVQQLHVFCECKVQRLDLSVSHNPLLCFTFTPNSYISQTQSTLSLHIGKLYSEKRWAITFNAIAAIKINACLRVKSSKLQKCILVAKSYTKANKEFLTSLFPAFFAYVENSFAG